MQRKSQHERQSLGDFGERVVAAHLEARGYTIIDRKFRVPEAELDLVARRGDDVVFIEVRTRRGGETGMAALSVNASKAAKVLHAVEWYLERHPELGELPARIDVVTVELDRDGRLLAVEHFEDAIRP